MADSDGLPGVVPLPAARKVAVAASTVETGLPIAAIDRVRLMSADEWEDFVLEWGDSLRGTYELVERCGGAGDMGRDVIAHADTVADVWDNYQCKHYAHGLAPSDVWLELGKLMYYTYTGRYSLPRKYVFVAPRGAGTKLSNLLRAPAQLSAGLLDNWDRYCARQITTTEVVSIEGGLLKHVESINFDMFSAVPPLRLIEQHRATPHHAARFGGGLPVRQKPTPPPTELQEVEAKYVAKLLAAYGDHLGRPINAQSDLGSDVGLADHLADARIDFFSAEALQSFSRDHLPDGEFEDLQDQFHHGIKNDLRSGHKDGLGRVNAALATARSLQVANHSLSSVLSVYDRGGICHQLADHDRVEWVKD